MAIRESIAYDKDAITGKITKYIKHKPSNAAAKGIAKIQLFNAKTGAMEREVLSENIITDLPAIMGYYDFVTQSFIKGAPTYSGWVGDSNMTSGSSFIASCPIAMLSLTDYTGAENPNDIMRGALIGCSRASGVANFSSSLIYGTYNAVESKTTIERVDLVTEKVSHHIVIDFGTNVCNGTFSTIYLHANQSEWRQDNFNNAIYKAQDTTKKLSIPVERINKTEPICSTFGDGYVLNYHGSGTDSSLHYVFTRKNILTNEVTTYKRSDMTYIEKEGVDQSSVNSTIYDITRGTSYGFAYDGVNNVAYMRSYNNNGTFNSFRHIIVLDFKNMQYYVKDVRKDIKVSYATTYVPEIFMYKGNLYVCYFLTAADGSIISYIGRYNNQLILTKFGHNKTGARSLTSSRFAVSTQHGPLIFSEHKENGILVNEMFDADCNFIGFIDYNNTYVNRNVTYHECINGFATNGDTSVIDYGYKLYYALKPTAHNKLPSPVTKTAANTMKIQYDIEYEIKHPFYKNPTIV